MDIDSQVKISSKRRDHLISLGYMTIAVAVSGKQVSAYSSITVKRNRWDRKLSNFGTKTEQNLWHKKKNLHPFLHILSNTCRNEIHMIYRPHKPWDIYEGISKLSLMTAQYT